VKNIKQLAPKISLDGVILFMMSIPFIMKYRISPGETPYWLFTAIFILLLSYFFVTREKIKTILVWVIIVFTIGSALLSSLVWRHKTAPEFGVHDIILQQESAIRFFLDGVNPYKTDYFGTPIEKWHYSDTEVNPALYHFVMPPFYLFFSLPFYVVSNMFLGYFDGRMPLIFAFFGTLGLLTIWVKPSERPLALTLFAFNPGTIDYFIEGRSDFFMHFFLIASLFLLYKKKVLFSSIFLALAFVVKQSVWPFFPLYFFYIYKKHKEKLVKSISVFGFTFLITILPFLLWDWRSLLNSTVFYLTSSGPENYPISGYGFGMLMKQFGVVKDVHDYFPFTIYQIVIGLPILLLLCYWLNKKMTIRNLLFSYSIFLFVFWYFSRYLNNSHVGYISSLLLTSYFIPDDNEKK
jgi:hypothetical protein